MLSSIDWVLLGVLGLSALLGLLRGFVAEVLSMVVWVAAFWLAFLYGAVVADALPVQMHDAAGRLLLAYAAVFIAAMVAGSVMTWLIGKLVRSAGLGGLDRFLGLAYGLMRGVALGCVLVLVLGFTALPREPEWRDSPLLPSYQSGAEWIRNWLPEAAAKHVDFSAVVAQNRDRVLKVLSSQVMQAASSPVEPQENAASGTATPSEESTVPALTSQPRTSPHHPRNREAGTQSH